ncbi:hypothetical protein C4K15_1948 [Pseudomonas chlororaphis subsp. aurantiaca]|nr:hypothetical protein C4K15_1948 [Pseudomonas chlororaphis subsp. aurantiaca]
MPRLDHGQETIVPSPRWRSAFLQERTCSRSDFYVASCASLEIFSRASSPLQGNATPCSRCRRLR